MDLRRTMYTTSYNGIPTELDVQRYFVRSGAPKVLLRTPLQHCTGPRITRQSRTE